MVTYGTVRHQSCCAGRVGQPLLATGTCV